MATKQKNQPDQSKKVIYKLQYPIEVGSEMLEQLELRRPTGADIMDLGGNANMGKLLEVAAKISATPPGIIKKLDAVDCIKLAEVVGNFLDNGQGIGENA